MRAADLVSNRLIVHASSERGLVGSWDHSLFLLPHGSTKPQKLFDLPPPAGGLLAGVKHRVARSHLRQWLRPHLGIDHAICTADGRIVVVYDRIYVWEPGNNTPWICNTAEVGSFCGPLRGGMAVHPGDECVYFGEYINDKSTPSVRVLRINLAARRLETCWTFSRKDVRHIHAIHHDRYRNRLWVTTGDADHESAIYYTDDAFNSLHKLGGGDQSWRAISIMDFAEHIEWGMDAGKDAPASAVNKVFRHELATGKREEVANIGNPAYAAARCTDGSWVLATTYEPGRKQATPEAAGLWWRSAAGAWQQLAALEYNDSGMSTVSRYGMLYLPYGELPAGTALFTAINCSQAHLKTFRLALA